MKEFINPKQKRLKLDHPDKDNLEGYKIYYGEEGTPLNFDSTFIFISPDPTEVFLGDIPELRSITGSFDIAVAAVEKGSLNEAIGDDDFYSGLFFDKTAPQPAITTLIAA